MVRVRSAWMRRVGLALSLGVGSGVGLSGGRAEAKGTRIDRIVAVVGPNIVLESDLRRELALSPIVAARLSQFTQKPSPQEIAALREELAPQVLDALVGDHLVLLEAQKYPSLALSEAELESYLLNIAKGNQMNAVDDLRKEVERSGEYGSWAEYRNTMRRQVGVYKVEVSLVPVPEVTDTEVRARYRELGKGEEARVRVRRWEFPDKPQASAKMQALGQDPAQAGQEVEILRGASAPIIEDALFAAGEGDVVGPLQVGQRWLVFAVDEVVESKLADFATVREQIRRQLEEERRVKATRQYRDGLRANNHVEVRR